MRWDDKNAEVFVFTKKEGLLSAVAHDLKLRVERFSIEADPDKKTVHATFDAASVRVVCALRHGAEAPDALSARERADIERNIIKDVLRPQKHPEIRFVADVFDGVDDAAHDSVDDGAVVGKLTLCGVTQAVRVTRSRDEKFHVGKATLDQRAFGIEPYSAMMGTLKIRPDVEVLVRLAKAGDETPRS